MKILEFQVKLVSELSANPVDRHPALVPDGTMLHPVEISDSLDISKVEILRRIGLGTHSEVYAVRNSVAHSKQPTFEFAAKIEKPIKQAIGCLIREIEILKALSTSTATPRYLGAFTVSIGGVDCLAAGIELFDESLSSLRQPSTQASDQDRAQLLDWLYVRMFEALFKIHDRGYLHRDIKPSNFMYKVGNDGAPRLALVDFGSAVAIGERNEFPFRGTGAYSALIMDPMESKPVDDYWSVAFCILDLSMEGGLPWRSLSARTEEGRSEIFRQKVEMLEKLQNGQKIGKLTSLGNKLVLSLFQNSDSSAFRTFVESISAGLDYDVAVLIDQLRPSNYRQAHLPKPLQRVAIPKIPLHGKYRNDIPSISSRCAVFDSSSCIEELKSESFRDGLLALCGAVTTHADQSSTPLVEGKRICISDLIGNCMLKNCPLLHMPLKGIRRSAVNRHLQQDGLCVESLIWKCRDETCKRVHLSKEDLDGLFLQGLVPTKRVRR